MLLLLSSVNAQTYFAGKTPDQIIELKKMATLKFEIYDSKGKLRDTFGGFLIGKEGRFASVYHPFKDEFKFNDQTVLKIKDSSDNEYGAYTIEACSNKNNLDICTGKIPGLKPKYYFEFSTKERHKGELFSSISHCGFDEKKTEILKPFNAKKGEVLKSTGNYHETYRDQFDADNKNTKIFEVNLDKCVGDSGGPIFDQYSGALIGAYSFFTKVLGATRFNYFAIDAMEIKKFFEENANKVLYEIKDPCASAKAGTREYQNCKALE